MGEAKRRAALGRLAMRVEGDYWVAYWTELHSMDRAIRIGTLKMTLVANPVIKDAFMELMKQAFSQLAKDTLGVDTHWPDPPEPGPEHERSGRA